MRIFAFCGVWNWRLFPSFTACFPPSCCLLFIFSSFHWNVQWSFWVLLTCSTSFIWMGWATLGLLHDIPICKGLGSFKGTLALIARHSTAIPFLWLLLANLVGAWIWILNLRFSLHPSTHSLLGFRPYRLAQNVKIWVLTIFYPFLKLSNYFFFQFKYWYDIIEYLLKSYYYFLSHVSFKCVNCTLFAT